MPSHEKRRSGYHENEWGKHHPCNHNTQKCECTAYLIDMDFSAIVISPLLEFVIDIQQRRRCIQLNARLSCHVYVVYEIHYGFDRCQIVHTRRMQMPNSSSSARAIFLFVQRVGSQVQNQIGIHIDGLRIDVEMLG
jgi:hypothetical protein